MDAFKKRTAPYFAHHNRIFHRLLQLSAQIFANRAFVKTLFQAIMPLSSF